MTVNRLDIPALRCDHGRFRSAIVHNVRKSGGTYGNTIAAKGAQQWSKTFLPRSNNFIWLGCLPRKCAYLDKIQ